MPTSRVAGSLQSGDGHRNGGPACREDAAPPDTVSAQRDRPTTEGGINNGKENSQRREEEGHEEALGSLLSCEKGAAVAPFLLFTAMLPLIYFQPWPSQMRTR